MKLAVPPSVPSPVPPKAPSSGLGRWLLAHQVHHPDAAETSEVEAHAHPWWQVMCLTGVDYFSSLSYVPGIAVLAAGTAAPLATLLIVLLTLLGALPMYFVVSRESPHGQGSVAMLERLLPFWRGKLLVLTLLGFVATAWIITITLSAADASVHLLENPHVPSALHGKAVLITLLLLLILGGVFLMGFTEAVKIAIPLVAVFLLLNAIIVGKGFAELIADPHLFSNWTDALTPPGASFIDIVKPAILAFPLLALGLSGFETGVSMMPLIAAEGASAEQRLASRIRNTRKLLTSAAVIMSAYLISSSLVTTLLIPAEAFQAGGQANGRALAYLAHEHLGETFGTAYDISSILILWFAGASAMAGLINIVPRYLPAYGMAPEWGRAVRPVVLFFTTVCIVITLAFRADVGAQAGAYATGVLAMILSGAFAVTVASRRANNHRAAAWFAFLTAVVLYALVKNVIDQPEGIVLAAVFILGIILISLISRVQRTTELRVERIEFDENARQFITESILWDNQLDIIANRRQAGDSAEYEAKEAEQRGMNPIQNVADVLFLEIDVIDPSAFSDVLRLRGVEVDGGFRVLRAESPAAPNAIAAILLALRDATGLRPHCYFEWSEGSPVGHLFRYLLLGQGDTPPVVREILREVEPDLVKRPAIHVGG